jgi:hypothetical protein
MLSSCAIFFVPCRELQQHSKRSSEQIEALNSRVAELDVDNRALRDQKYQLDTQVGIEVRFGSLGSTGSGYCCLHSCKQLPDTILKTHFC